MNTKPGTQSRKIPHRVLVVEDNPDLARMVTLMLQFHGMEVRSLSHGRPVLDTARSFRPHFILLDIGLPDMDGYQIAQAIRGDEDLDNVVIIAVSAFSPDLYPGGSRLAKFDHYFVKPVDFDSLISLLRSAGP
jgi:DNA-binding response OmpR family regulator